MGKGITALENKLRKSNGGYTDDIEIKQHAIANSEARMQLSLAMRRVRLAADRKEPTP